MTMKITPYFRWYDLWVGIYKVPDKPVLYFGFFPTLGIKFEWAKTVELSAGGSFTTHNGSIIGYNWDEMATLIGSITPSATTQQVVDRLAGREHKIAEIALFTHSTTEQVRAEIDAYAPMDIDAAVNFVRQRARIRGTL